jgi:hypothetical protein
MSGIFLVRKLNAFIPLRTDGERAIEGLASKRVKSLPRGHDIISEGEDPKTVNLIVDGWACRYKILKDGRRQILAFFVPGDLADLIVYMSTYWMRWIIPSGPSRLCNMQCSPPAEFEKLGDDPPRVLRALWRDSLLTASIQRGTWRVNDIEGLRKLAVFNPSYLHHLYAAAL